MTEPSVLPERADLAHQANQAPQSLPQTLVSLGRSVLGSLAGTALLMFPVTCIGVWLGVLGAVGTGGAWERGLWSTPLVLLLCGVLTALLAVKRAVLTALIRGAERFTLGQRVAQALFGALLGVKDDGAPAGERGNALAQRAEKLPLAEAEARLRSAAARLRSSAGADGVRGFFAARLHEALVEKIEAVTLARFRGDAAAGVDLLKLRDELSRSADQLVSDRLRGTRLQLTVLLAGAALLGSFVAGKIVGLFL